MEIQAISSQNVTVGTTTQNMSDAGNPKVEPITVDYKKGEEKGESSFKKSQDDQSVIGAEQIDPEKVKRAVASMNQKIKQTHTSFQFSYHEETHRISIKVIDDDSQKVIREIPPEKTLDMIAKSLELAGILVDEKR